MGHLRSARRSARARIAARRSCRSAPLFQFPFSFMDFDPQARHPPAGGGAGAGKSFGNFLKARAKQTPPKHDPADPFAFTESQSSAEEGRRAGGSGAGTGRGGGALSGQRGARTTPKKNPPLVKQNSKRAAKRDFTFDLSSDDEVPAPSKAPPARSEPTPPRSSAPPARAPPSRSTSHAQATHTSQPVRETGVGGDRGRGRGAFEPNTANHTHRKDVPRAAPPPTLHQQQRSARERQTEQRAQRDRESEREKEREEHDAVSGATQLFQFEVQARALRAMPLHDALTPFFSGAHRTSLISCSTRCSRPPPRRLRGVTS